MKIAEVQFNSWDNTHQYLVGELNLNLNDYVIVEYQVNKEIGRIVDIKDIDEKNIKKTDDQAIKPVLRKAKLKDLEKLEEFEKNKNQIFETANQFISKHKLPMKLVDVQQSFDNKKMTFAFIAEGRVDFRQLVKDLTRQYQKSIRLQQLGVRDEAKINGDIGACGIQQCCKTHLRELGNVSSDQAEIQQVSHRGAERLSGICNRLKCCLRYENDAYQELASKFPAIGSVVKTERGKGQVKEWHLLKQTVNVLIDEDTYIEVALKDLK